MAAIVMMMIKPLIRIAVLANQPYFCNFRTCGMKNTEIYSINHWSLSIFGMMISGLTSDGKHKTSDSIAKLKLVDLRRRLTVGDDYNSHIK
jgi:hypothetical protein